MYRTAVAGLRIMLFFIKIYDTELLCANITSKGKKPDLTIEFCLRNERMVKLCKLTVQVQLRFCNEERKDTLFTFPRSIRAMYCMTNFIKEYGVSSTHKRYILREIIVRPHDACTAYISKVVIRQQHLVYEFTCKKIQKCTIYKEESLYLDNYKERCSNQRFVGRFCTIQCNCVSQRCFRTGECALGKLCNAGYSGTTCQDVCLPGTFGRSCKKICYCKGNQTCDAKTGRCPSGCEPSYSGEDCQQRTICEMGKWGVNCDKKCHCKEGIHCDKNSGVCPWKQCSARFMGDTCQQTCPEGKYLNKKQTVCDNACRCEIPSSCLVTNGTCVSGGCTAGYTGKNCDIACQNGTYGHGCKLPCNCLNAAPCDKVTGSCSNGCKVGFAGVTCENSKYTTTAQRMLYTGVISCVAIVFCLAVGIYFIKYNKTCNPNNALSHPARSSSLICAGSSFVDLSRDPHEYHQEKSRLKRKKKRKHKSKTEEKKKHKKNTSSSSSSSSRNIENFHSVISNSSKDRLKGSLSFNEKVEMKHYIKDKKK